MNSAGRLSRIWAGVVGLACAALGLVLVIQIANLADREAGLAMTVAASMEESGVTHPPTAVLLNFRSYDTWLEIVVLLGALLGVLWLADRRDLSHVKQPAEVALLRRLVDVVLPLAVLGGVFLLAQGTGAPGGAFQAGAIVGAGFLLGHLAGWQYLGRLHHVLPVAAAGVIAFGTVGLTAMVIGRPLLDLPAGAAYPVIVGLEVAIAISTALTLVMLVLVAAPPGGDKDER